MSGFQLLLQALEPELMGAPVVVDVLDENLHLVAQEAVTVGDQHYFEVPAGRYGLQALLPSGRWLTDSVAVDKRAPTPHVMDLSEISPHESLQRTVVLKSAPFETPGSLNEWAYRSIWVRLWARSEGTWSVERWPQPQASWDSDAVTYWFQTDRRQYMLQLGGPQIPWKMVSLPAAQRLEVSVRPSGNEDEPGLAMTVATDNNLAEALLGYLTIGALGHADLVSKQAEALLFGKVADPAAAAVGGYYLLRVSDLERLHNWPQNLANWMQWMPDGAVIHAWQLIREQQEAQEPSEDALSTARDRLLEAVERGIPVYTEGLRLLVAGLKLLDFEADGRDRDVRDALHRVRPFAAAADLGQPTTTFTGSSPLSASPSAAYGMPESHTGLAFLYNVQLQDLVDLGLIRAETPLSLLGFSSAPAEARFTAQGTIRLWDGREYTDPSKAAAEAVFSDSWFNWSVPGGNTLSALRQQARTGRMGDHGEVSSPREVRDGSAEASPGVFHGGHDAKVTRRVSGYGSTFILVATYPDEATARDDYQVVKDAHAAGVVGSYDAAVVTKDANGKVHENKDETATRHGAWWGVAAGAAIGVIFPPAVLGAAAVGGVVGGVTGHLSKGMSRSQAKQLGDFIDPGQAGLVIVGESKVEDAIKNAVTRAEKQTAQELGVDPKDIDKALQESVKEM